ncbi:hypothetical protein cyc_06442 [Cyclospora cayetanensis]|uniref:Transmembrane protein n=1 Tax=Cyclospora cayetanensis TaxID=88456 RepID=A0A1D3D686_9EIME|nr:hypothetical protein cyc_06442 [Cyclospora cayetanensis]
MRGAFRRASGAPRGSWGLLLLPPLFVCLSAFAFRYPRQNAFYRTPEHALSTLQLSEENEGPSLPPEVAGGSPGQVVGKVGAAISSADLLQSASSSNASNAAHAAAPHERSTRSSTEGAVSLHQSLSSVVDDLSLSLKSMKQLEVLKEKAEETRHAVVLDVMALNHTIQQEYANIQKLRTFEQEQGKALKAQLTYLIPEITTHSHGSNVAASGTEDAYLQTEIAATGVDAGDSRNRISPIHISNSAAPTAATTAPSAAAGASLAAAAAVAAAVFLL